MTGEHPNPHRDALLNLHRGLFPERYPRELQPDHEYWDGNEGDAYQWDSGTIEWVANDIERALADDPDAQLDPNYRAPTRRDRVITPADEEE